MLPTKTILIIDDDQGLRVLFREALTLEGYRVLEAGDGREGVRLFQEAHPDLVLLDIIMPEKDGIETLREILAIDPAARVITFSGREGAGVHNEAAELLGAVSSLRKPFTMADLVGAVREALGDEAPVRS